MGDGQGKTRAAAATGLTDAEHDVALAIAMFAEPPTLEDVDALVAIAAIADRADRAGGADGVAMVDAESDALRPLEALMERGLVVVAGARLRLDAELSTELMQAAAAKSNELRASSLALAHAELILSRSEATAARAYGPEAEDALARLTKDLANIRTAAHRVGAARPATAARLVLTLADVATFGRLLAPTDPLFASAVAWADASANDDLRARTRHVHAKMRLEERNPHEARARLAEARTFVHDGKTGDLERTLGWACIADADLEGAAEALEKAVALHRHEQAGRGVADAFAALGVVARLRDDAKGAAHLFGSAGAVHMLMGDRIRAAKVREMAALLGVDLPIVVGEHVTTEALLAEAETHRASGRHWRESIARLELAKRAGSVGDAAMQATHLASARASAAAAGARPEWILALEAKAANAGADAARANAAAGAKAWQLESSGTTTMTPDERRIDLKTRAVLRRVFAALIEARAAQPGHPLDVEAILAAGWPGERVLHAAGLLRVYTAIKRLRALGLDPILQTVENGYLLDPDVEMNILPSKSLRSPV